MDPADLRNLVEASLGPSGAVWRPLAAQKQQREDALDHDAKKTSVAAKDIGDLAKAGNFKLALKLMDDLGKQERPEILGSIVHRDFMHSAKTHKQPAMAVAFLHALPKRFHDVRLYNMALQVRMHTDVRIHLAFRCNL